MATDALPEDLGPVLTCIHKKYFGLRPIDPDKTAFCSPHELLAAIVYTTQDVDVFRLNGELVFTIKHRDQQTRITDLKFKPDGSVLGVGYADGVCALHSGENGKLIGQVKLPRDPLKDDWKLDLTPNQDVGGESMVWQSRIISIGWCTHVRPYDEAASPTESDEAHEEQLTTEQWADKFERASDSERFNSLSKAGMESIAEELTKFDVTTVLPKLSPIPSFTMIISKEAAKFTTQAGVDSVFDPSKTIRQKPYGGVDLLLVANAGGDVVVLLDDTEVVAETEVDEVPSWHGANAHCSSHAFLHPAEFPGDMPDSELRTTYIDFPMPLLGGPLLHVISTNTKRIQNLMVYISQTIRGIEHQWTTGLMFPTRFITNINEELAEKGEGDLVTNLYHLAMTGTCNRTIEEWLTDVVKENNHRRWDQTVRNLYTRIQDYIFVNLIPALDRLAIATMALRGQALFHEGPSRFDVSTKLFTDILDVVDALRMVAQKVQLMIMTEQRQFAAFSKWLRVMIDICAEPGTARAAETEEREVPNFDYNQLLPYIKDVMTGRQLGLFVGKISPEPPCDEPTFFAHPRVANQSYDRTKKALQDFEDDKLLHADEVAINMSSLAVAVNGHARYALETITKWQGKMIRSTPQSTTLPPVSFEVPDNEVLDVRMVVNEFGSEFQIYLSSNQHDDKKGRVSRISQRRAVGDNMPGTVVEHRIEDKEFDGEIQSFVVLDDDSALVLVNYIYNPEASPFRYTVVKVKFAGPQELAGSPEGRISLLHGFMRAELFEPYRLIVSERSGLRVLIVINEQGTEWRVFELDRPGATLRDA